MLRLAWSVLTTTQPTTGEGTEPDLAALASLLADRTRASFCTALLDGRAWTAGELARHAGVAPSTASEHLTALVGAGLLAEVRQGRHRYVRLASRETAELIEAMSAAAPKAAPPRGLTAVHRSNALARGRTCYDHLAGALGVAVAEAVTERGWIDWEDGPSLTAGGRTGLAGLGVELPARTRRPLVRSCLDWTERRPHVAGAVGAALCSRALEAGWLVRPGGGRAVRVTAEGRAVLAGALGVPDGVLESAGA